jgi:prophage maintenance system killer protein
MHPIYQGNKRTALEAAQMLLYFNNDGSIISGNPEKINEFVREISVGKYDIEEIIEWITSQLL